MYGDFPYKRYLVGVRCRPKPARAKNVLCILGALLGSERRQLFPPCLLAFPPCGEQSPTLSFPPDAHPRPNALTLDPTGSLVKNGASYSVAPCSLASPTLPAVGAPPTLSLPPGLALLCGRARPATLYNSSGAPYAYSLDGRTSRVFAFL